MKTVALKAFPRSLKRRKGSKAVRSQGRIPASIYGKSIQPANLELDAEVFDELVHSAHSEVILLDLSVEGESAKRLVLVQEVQHHALSGDMLHVDLHEVRPDEKVTIRVPVESTGVPAGVKSGGGTLEHVLLKLRVRAFPGDLPENITVDVSGLEVGVSLHIGEIKAPAGVEILGNKNVSVFTCAAPTKEEEVAPAATDAAKQPEMLKEKKGDEAAPAAGKDGKADEKKPAAKK